jgi:hypothetical protein
MKKSSIKNSSDSARLIFEKTYLPITSPSFRSVKKSHIRAFQTIESLIREIFFHTFWKQGAHSQPTFLRMKKLILFMLTLASFSVYSQDLTKDQIQHLADTMLISSSYKISVKKILPAVNNIQVALVELPYREFPSILVFSKNPTTNKWTRVLEGLSPGIQESASDMYDWHKVSPSLGKDFATKDTANNFSSNRVVQLVDAVGFQKAVIIPYQNFFHYHTLGDPKSQPFAPYTIDKTKYRNFGNLLFKNRFDAYPKMDCGIYNSPGIDDVSFEFKDNKYILVAKTDNKQQWTYTFDKVDGDVKYLVNKTIAVEKAK